MINAKVISDVNEKLKAIFNDRSLSPEERGELGEEIIYDLVKYWASFYESHFIERSYMYPQGKIHRNDHSAEREPITETDILLITPYRIFVIEVKTVYGYMRIHESSNIEISKDNTFNGTYEKKNHLQQNEMHARHLYYHLHKLLPDGNPNYIIPLLTMSGKMRVEDYRAKYLKQKYPITNVSGLVATLDKFNVPDKFLLDVKAIEKKLRSIQVHDKERLLNSQVWK